MNKLNFFELATIAADDDGRYMQPNATKLEM